MNVLEIFKKIIKIDIKSFPQKLNHKNWLNKLRSST